jgi:hypothetical protein
VASLADCRAALLAVADRALNAAEPVAVEMAQAFTDHVTTVTLRRSSHDRLSKTPSPPGSPPSWVDGRLAGSFVVIPEGGGGGVGRAVAGPTVIYAAVQEFGAEIHVRNRRYLMWRTSYITDATNFEKSFREGGGTWLNFAKSVRIPERDYMRRGLEEVLASGELERRKIAVFMALVWGG